MLPAGARLQDKYVVERILGRGGMGAVYQAIIPSLGGKRVAIKEMQVAIENPEARDSAVRQFKREAQLLALLDHPGLVDVTDAFEENGNQYLVMALVEGTTLESVLQRNDGFLDIGQVLQWTEQLIDVLDYLHTQSPPIIFRDLKPTNIMLDARQRVRLIDFGIARSFEADSHTTTIIKGACTPGFSPVEQFGGGSTDARSDIYALGATMFMLLTRCVPPVSVQLLSGEDVMRDPVALNPAIPRALGDVVLKMMGLRKTDRYQTIAEVRDALRAATMAPEPAPPAPVPVLAPPALPSTPAPPPPRRSGVPAILTVLALAGLGAAGVWRSATGSAPVEPLKRTPVAISCPVPVPTLTSSAAPSPGGSSLPHLVEVLSSAVPQLLPPATIVFTKLSPGVTVKLDGKSVEVRTRKPLAVPAGHHVLVVSKKHYQPVELSADPEAGKEADLEAELLPLPGVLAIDSAPAGAKVVLGGKVVGQTPLSLQHDPGTWTVQVEKEGYTAWHDKVQIDPDETRKVQVTLDPVPIAAPPPPPPPVYHPRSVYVAPAPPPNDSQHSHGF